jgi:hypothetical protein
VEPWVRSVRLTTDGAQILAQAYEALADTYALLLLARLGSAFAPADIVLKRAKGDRCAERQGQQRGDNLEHAMSDERAAGRPIVLLHGRSSPMPIARRPGG